jgi:hypothetical protein
LMPTAVAVAVAASLVMVAERGRDRGLVPAAAPASEAMVAWPARGAPSPAAEPGIPMLVPDIIDLDVRVSPRSAQITIDDVQAPNNPFHARLPKDGKTHKIVAMAVGYDPKVEEVTFSGDVAVDLGLDRTAPSRRAATHPASAVLAAPPAPAARPAHLAGADPLRPAVAPSPSPDVGAHARAEGNAVEGRLVQRPIVTTNPYGAP